MPNKLKPLIIGDLKINIPIFQGGMGVKVSTAPLVSAVANCGGAGTIASVGLFDGLNKKTAKFVQESSDSLRKEIRKTKKLTNGVFGVNIMVALSNYEELVKVSVQEEADFIVSGAGLPLRLPKLVEGSNIKLIIIVSS
ncbi:MAG: nitronate monooxygenase, partial [Elusimicrobiaceae bacterium]|nr:nitronate monooxygenase [Elusimicrobiaceae bacterium]